MTDNIIEFKKPNIIKPNLRPYDVHIAWCICPTDDDETVYYPFDHEAQRMIFLQLLNVFGPVRKRKSGFDFKVFDTPHYYRDGVWHEGTIFKLEGSEKPSKRLKEMSSAAFKGWLFRHSVSEIFSLMGKLINEE